MIKATDWEMLKMKLEASLYSFSKGDLDSSKENVSKFYNVKFKFNQLSLLKTKCAMTRSKARCGANRVNAISIFLSPREKKSHCKVHNKTEFLR